MSVRIVVLPSVKNRVDFSWNYRPGNSLPP
jgi:hypothetical protein